MTKATARNRAPMTQWRVQKQMPEKMKMSVVATEDSRWSL